MCGWSRSLGRGGSRSRGGEAGRGPITQRAVRPPGVVFISPRCRLRERSCPRRTAETARRPGVRIGLTFRAGITNRRTARVLQGGIMAFGNRLLPCTLRTSGGRPIAGGLPPQDSGHDHCDDHVGHRDDGGHEKHRGRARSPAGGKTAPSCRRGKSTGPNGPSRGGGAKTPVDSKNPRQPSGTERLSKGTSGGRT